MPHEGSSCNKQCMQDGEGGIRAGKDLQQGNKAQAGGSPQFFGHVQKATKSKVETLT